MHQLATQLTCIHLSKAMRSNKYLVLVFSLFLAGAVSGEYTIDFQDLIYVHVLTNFHCHIMKDSAHLYINDRNQ